MSLHGMPSAAYSSCSALSVLAKEDTGEHAGNVSDGYETKEALSRHPPSSLQLDEDLLALLVNVVDAKLLETVGIEDLKT